MNFTYVDENTLSLTTDDAMTINLYFSNGRCNVIDVGGTEFDALDDTLDKLRVLIGGEKRLSDVVREANVDWLEIVADAEAEAKLEADMARELSSPRQTGRI